jgi:hypothetical protein
MRATPVASADGTEVVLDREGHAVEGTDGPRLRQRGVGAGGLRQGALGVDLHHGVDRRVDLLDAPQVGVDDLHRRDRPRAEQAGESQRGRLGEIGRAHRSATEICSIGGRRAAPDLRYMSMPPLTATT